MRPLSAALRKQLETSVLAARRAAESASRAALDGLGVFADRRPDHLDADRVALRVGLRAKWRQLGSDNDVLVSECAYEQWHRLLFARFLAENGLLLHPQFNAPVTLADCEELTTEVGEPDAWSVAGRFAAEILPGIFNLKDPCVQLRLAPEGRDALERILDALPAETFAADDALGWVYQFWQKDKKAEVNDSERKIAGTDLGPITQLFTEHYMVRFLLENSLGAWWAWRHPTSPLLADFSYLRVNGDGHPAAGAFEGWPDRVADVTFLDPCCGSGHFLVEAFSMLWRMRAEEDGLSETAAQDAVLRDNLFGLELDPRCVQIAMFALALQAWKTGGRWRDLPVPNVACSGMPVNAPADDWRALADGQESLETALDRLHVLFRHADTLGSLIDPRDATTTGGLSQLSVDHADWQDVGPRLAHAMQSEEPDPAAAVLGGDARTVVRATDVLARRFTLVATNPPFLAVGRMGSLLRDFLSSRYPSAKHDLSTALFARQLTRGTATSIAMVLPENWLHTTRYESLRRELLRGHQIRMLGWLGSGAFQTNAIGSRVRVVLLVATPRPPAPEHHIAMVDVASAVGANAIAAGLRTVQIRVCAQSAQVENPDARITSRTLATGQPLATIAEGRYGLRTGDAARLIRKFWEFDAITPRWRLHQSTVPKTTPYGGREDLLDWSDGKGALHELARAGIAALQGQDAWGRRGVAVSLTGEIRSTLYDGTSFDNNCAVIWPRDSDLLPAVWAYCASTEFHENVRAIDDSLKVMNATLLKVPFDVERWREIADQAGPLPEPWSDDPKQWLFPGGPELTKASLQVAVARLLGYRWPAQVEADDLQPLADADGVVCLPPVAGEPPAAERVQRVLAMAFGDDWTPGKVLLLLEHAGSEKKNLHDWLRDEFFKQHCALFGNRPFVWHIWDGLRDGFSALVNYHRLDRKTLEKITFTYLGQDWIERQRAEARDNVSGADSRLAAALALQRKLEAILEGEDPYDIFVRWKLTHEQPIGWDPDLNDGVRLNVRPFVEAGVLRAPFNIHWRKDRGKNPDGSEHENDIHLTLAEKQSARKRAGMA